MFSAVQTNFRPISKGIYEQIESIPKHWFIHSRAASEWKTCIVNSGIDVVCTQTKQVSKGPPQALANHSCLGHLDGAFDNSINWIVTNLLILPLLGAHPDGLAHNTQSSIKRQGLGGGWGGGNLEI